MPIAFDAAVDGGNNGGVTNSLSFSHTCTGSDRILFVGIVGDVITGGVDDVTSVTYNGVAMTLVNKRTTDLSGCTRFTYLYVLVAPSTGANNVVLTFGSSHYILGEACSYTGAEQTGQPDASTNSGAASNVSSHATALSSVLDNCWFVLVEQGSASNNAPAAGTGSTRRAFDATFGTIGMFDSNGPKTPAGSYSMTTTYPSTPLCWIVHVMASFAPATVTGTPAAKRVATVPFLGGSLRQRNF